MHGAVVSTSCPEDYVMYCDKNSEGNVEYSRSLYDNPRDKR